ncbi:MAG: VOC family protein [Deltaproteobacteria bacterium]|nr:VOC family protein [Deltaproteobacteria bacterium]
MFKRIDHFEIVPSDVEKTIDFYTNVLEFKMKFRKQVDAPPMKEVVFLELGDTVLELISAQSPAPRQEDPLHVGYRGLAIEVESMGEAVKYLRGKGVELASGPVDLGTSLRAEIRDPDGLVIELREWK